MPPVSAFKNVCTKLMEVTGISPTALGGVQIVHDLSKGWYEEDDLREWEGNVVNDYEYER